MSSVWCTAALASSSFPMSKCFLMPEMQRLKAYYAVSYRPLSHAGHANLEILFGKVGEVGPRDPIAIYFKNFIEVLEEDPKKKNGTIYAKLRGKYIGLRLRDDEEGDIDAGGDEQEGAEKYLGEIIGIDFKSKIKSAYQNGYCLMTALIRRMWPLRRN